MKSRYVLLALALAMAPALFAQSVGRVLYGNGVPDGSTPDCTQTRVYTNSLTGDVYTSVGSPCAWVLKSPALTPAHAVAAIAGQPIAPSTAAIGAGSAITSSGPGGALASGAYAPAFNSGAVAVTGGAIDGTPIGGTTPAAVAATALSATQQVVAPSAVNNCNNGAMSYGFSDGYEGIDGSGGYLQLCANGTQVAQMTGGGFSAFQIYAPAILPHFTVSTLPAAGNYPMGATVVVSDSSGTLGATCVGGGSAVVLALDTGSSWTCH